MFTVKHRFIISSLFFSFFVLQPVRPQSGSAAFPFLLINPSTESNGMGGTMISVTPTSPSSMLFNPAQLGMMSRTYAFSSDFYTNVTTWLPAFHSSDLWLNNYSMMYGLNLGNAFPKELSVGIGYSRAFLNLGDFIVTTEHSPDPIGTFRGYEEVDNYSLGFSIDVGPVIGFGTTVKRIQSHLSPTGTGNVVTSGTADVTGVDLGIVTKFPLARYFVTENEFLRQGLRPRFDLTLSYAINNLGGDVSYGDPLQKDPMPRTARVGWSVETGITINTAAVSFDFVQLTLAREVDDVLVKRNASSWRYKGLLGDIDLFKGLVESRQHRYVDVRRGFSIGMLETITYRQGSFDGDGNLAYKTNGITYSTRGLFTLIGSLIHSKNENSFAAYFLRHFEVRISQSEYWRHEIVGGTKFTSILLSFRQ